MTQRRSPLFLRFMSKVRAQESGCWEWQAQLLKGYGKFKMWRGDGWRPAMAHRVAYEMLRGPIPEGLELDHLCRNRACVNPDHLEPVTTAVNLARIPEEGRAKRGPKPVDRCRKGHEYTPENTYRAPSAPTKKHCRACATDAAKIRWQGILAAREAGQ